MFRKEWRKGIIQKGLMFLFVMLACIESESRVIRIAVIDSGYDGYEKTCDTGSYDLIANVPNVGKDSIGHGTSMVNIINDYAFSVKPCFIIIKVFGKNGATSENISRGIFKAIEAKADIINMSIDSNAYASKAEHDALWLAHSKGIKVMVASGNSGIDLDKACNIYPVCWTDVGITVVGSESSYIANHGKIVMIKEHFCYDDEGICGTSISAAIATGKWVKHKKGAYE